MTEKFTFDDPLAQGRAAHFDEWQGRPGALVMDGIRD